MKKESHWFSHDCNASSDPKLIALVSKHGMAGYGRWWRLVEMLRAEDGYKYCITTKFAYSVLAKELMLQADEAKQFIKDCIEEFQLLQTDDETIWSGSLLQRMEHLENKRASYSERGKKSGEARRRKATGPELISNTVQPADEQNRTNNIKEQETKQDNPKPLEGIPVDEGVVELEDFKTKALQDVMHFVYPIVSAGRINEHQLGDWLTAFNRLLACRGEKPKSPQDYRRHFINWFKFRNPAREDPKTFLLGHNKSPAPGATFLKTPIQIEEEQKQKRDEWKTKIAQ